MSDTQDQVQATEVEQQEVIESQETAVNQSPEDDIFDNIFGDNSGDFAFQTGESDDVTQNETTEVQTSVDPKEDATSFSTGKVKQIKNQ